MITQSELEHQSAKLAKVVLDGVLGPNRVDDVVTTINNACKAALSAAHERGRREGLEEAAKIAEDWFSVAPSYRTKERLCAAIRSRLEPKP